MKIKNFSLRDKDLHIVEKKKIWFAIPIVIVLIALIEFFAFAGVNDWDFSMGLNVGIDFTGGSSVSVILGDDYSEAKLNEIVKEVEKHGVQVSYAQKTGTGSSSAGLVKYKNAFKDDNKNLELNDEIKTALEAKFKGKEVTISAVGSTASGELLASSFLAIFVAAICIFVYIIFRFELWSGFSAVLALFHDLIIMFCLTLIFRIEINAPFIAALITILAYSINDTIVIFDRVRELIKSNTSQKVDYLSVTNHAISSTITRSLYTSITTLLTISIVAIFVPQIRNFALPIVFGIIAGTFSSVFIAAPLFYSIKNSMENSKRAKAEKALAAANGVEYVQENDYQKKQRVWNNIKSKFTSGSTKKTYTKVETPKEEISEVVEEKTEVVKKPKKPVTKYVNPKKKKKNK